MGWQRVEQQLHDRAQRRQVGFIPYLTVGYPDTATTVTLVEMLDQVGVDVVELGVPFSDPLADGPTIQRASFHALKHGVTFNRCLEVVAAIRGRGVRIPLVLMTYYNPLLAHGLSAAAHDVARAGADGFIVADLPPEEAAPLRAGCQEVGLALVPLLAPTSSAARVAAGCAGARGFVYCVSLTGVTGAREALAPDVARLIAIVRQNTTLPVAVGFGISKREHVAAIGAFADAAVVGSALLDVISKVPASEALPQARRFVAELVNVPISR